MYVLGLQLVFARAERQGRAIKARIGHCRAACFDLTGHLGGRGSYQQRDGRLTPYLCFDGRVPAGRRHDGQGVKRVDATGAQGGELGRGRGLAVSCRQVRRRPGWGTGRGMEALAVMTPAAMVMGRDMHRALGGRAHARISSTVSRVQSAFLTVTTGGMGTGDRSKKQEWRRASGRSAGEGVLGMRAAGPELTVPAPGLVAASRRARARERTRRTRGTAR